MLIKNIRYLVLEEGNWAANQGDIFIKDGKFHEIGNVKHAENENEIIDGKGMLAIPGLVNGHQHTPMSLLRCYCDDLPLMDWLNKKMQPAEMKMTDEDRYWGAMLSIAEMIKSGTTTYADMYIGMDTIGRAVEESGIRASLARGLIAMDSDYEGRLKEAADVVDKWHGKANGRITAMIAPHSPYLCPPEFLKDVVQLAKEKEKPLHTHLAETMDETAIIEKRYGMSPTAYLESAGMFDGTHVLLAHGVHFSKEDVAILKQIKGGIIHNPVSNAKLGCGISDVTGLMKEKITIGLGTDGAGSASTLDLFMEMKAATWMQKLLYKDASALSAGEVLKMATINGAEVLALGDEIGSIEIGKKADLTLIDMGKIHLTPAHDDVSLLVYSATGQDVDTVIIDGKVVMRGRELLSIDEEKVIFEAKARTEALIKRV